MPPEFWYKLEELFDAIGVPPPPEGTDGYCCIMYIQRAIDVVEDLKEYFDE